MSSSSADPPETANGANLGYGIAIAVGILVLISTIMLASYVCVRVKANGVQSGSDDESDSTTTTITRRSLPEQPVLVVGLDKPIIESYPIVVLGESKRLPKPNNDLCSICLSEYLPRDTLRYLPECKHSFHADCIDEWLRLSATCPICRTSPVPSVVPTPVATPLSELAPLAFHSR